MTPWRSVPRWCLGANDRFGTCFFAMVGNWHALATGQVMPDGEIENADREMTGFSPYDPSTDHGEYLEVGLRYIMDHGWPGDPTLRPVSWAKTPDLAATLRDHGSAMAWCMLPRSPSGEWDLTSAALSNSEEGAGAHAVLIVEQTPHGFWIVTWGEPRWVSAGWWAEYGRDCYEVVHPAEVATRRAVG